MIDCFTFCLSKLLVVYQTELIFVTQRAFWKGSEKASTPPSGKSQMVFSGVLEMEVCIQRTTALSVKSVLTKKK